MPLSNISVRVLLHFQLPERLRFATWVRKWELRLLFSPYDERMADYLKATGRAEVADMATAVAEGLRADDEVVANPEKYYDRIIDIDLSTLGALYQRTVYSGCRHACFGVCREGFEERLSP